MVYNIHVQDKTSVKVKTICIVFTNLNLTVLLTLKHILKM